MKTICLHLSLCGKVAKVKRSNTVKRYEKNRIIQENIMQLMQENKALWL